MIAITDGTKNIITIEDETIRVIETDCYSFYDWIKNVISEKYKCVKRKEANKKEKLEEMIRYDEWVPICNSCVKVIFEKFMKSSLTTLYLDFINRHVCSVANCSNGADYYILIKSEKRE